MLFSCFVRHGLAVDASRILAVFYFSSLCVGGNFIGFWSSFLVKEIYRGYKVSIATLYLSQLCSTSADPSGRLSHGSPSILQSKAWRGAYAQCGTWGVGAPRFCHGCCWETSYIFACCGLVWEIPTYLLKFKVLLPFQRQPSFCDVKQYGQTTGVSRCFHISNDTKIPFEVVHAIRSHDPQHDT